MARRAGSRVLAAAMLAALLVSTTVLAGPVLAQPAAPAPAARPVYVRDFAFDAGHAPKHDEGLLGGGEGPVRRLLQGRPLSEDAAAKARRLAELLTKTIVDRLTHEGYSARRFPSGAALPGQGWLVGGEFLEIDEGNRLRRAVVGFGAGKADVHVQVEIYDLARDPATPIMVYGASEASRKSLGAVPAILTRNPYGMAARYVLSRRTTEREIEKLGKQIASDLVKMSETTSSDPPR